MLTSEQLKARQSGIGGSDAAVALGLSPWKTARELYEEKIAPEPTVIEESPAMRWGNLLEPIIRQRYAEQTGRIVRVPDTIRSGSYPWLLCHLDGVTEDGRGLEIKTARSPEGWGEPGTDEIPSHYLIQVQHNLLVADLAVMDVPVLIGGWDERLYEIPADREMQAMLLDGEADFWRAVEKREPPDLDFAHPRILDIVRHLYPGTNGQMIQADTALEAWRRVMEEAYDRASNYKAVADQAKAHLLAAMGESALLKFDDGKMLRRQEVKRKAYSVPESTYVDARIVRAKE